MDPITAIMVGLVFVGVFLSMTLEGVPISHLFLPGPLILIFVATFGASAAGLMKSDLKLIADAGKRAKRAQAASKHGPPGPQCQAAPAALTVHIFQRHHQGREINEIEALFEVVGREVVNVIRETRQIEDGIEARAAHDLNHRVHREARELVGIVVPALGRARWRRARRFRGLHQGSSSSIEANHAG